jgi:class 3 adenylate cyclase/predicted ATPase
MTDIATWLEQLGLAKYGPIFSENEVELADLSELSEDDLKEIGLPLGPRRRILKAARALDAGDRVPRESTGDDAADAHTRVEAERRQLTVMFCDLVGSTELSARLDPEDLREVMRHYQDTVAGLVARFEGHVAKFLGDGVLAFFGWPRAYEDQAERAVRSGLAAVEAVANLKTEDGQALEARVGIATGQVVIGDIVGEAATEADAVAGETPNLAARLQGLAAPGQVLIGATTRLLIGEALDLEDIGTHQIKGFAEPVTAWRVVGESTAESRLEAAHPGALNQIVGREPELGLLRRAWQQSQAGVGQVVLISGEPGIGKSRLVEALGAELKVEGCTRITLGCSPYHTNSALYPLIVYFERVLRWQREDGADVKLAKLEKTLQDFSLPLDEAIPLFASLLSLPLPKGRYPPITVTPQRQKQQTLDAIVALLLEEAERQPVLQVWEDLHWADPSTLELLALEIEQTPTAPILNVMTFRPNFTPGWSQRSHMTPLTLNHLERPEAEALIGQQAGGKRLPEEVVEHIVDKTDGVPLYVEELTKAILEADFLREHDGGYQLTGPMSGIAIPATLQDSLMARLDRLPIIREVAQLGAVLGREFIYEMVQAIASIKETALKNGLEQLVVAELLYQRGRPPRAKYVFKHALVRDAAYESLLRSKRQELHQSVAEMLVEQFLGSTETEPEIVAHHYTEAGLTEHAIEYWHRAGRRAAERSANGEAVSHLNRALKLLLTLPEGVGRDSEELDLQVALTGPMIGYMGYTATETERVYARALELCGRVGESPKIFPVLFGWFSFHAARGEAAKCLGFAEDFLRRAERLDDDTFRMVGHRLVGTVSLMTGNLAPAIAHLDHAVALYDVDRHRELALTYAQDVKVSALCMRGLALWIQGYPGRAKDSAKEGLDLAEVLSHATTMGYAQVIGGTYLHSLCRDDSRVRDYAEAALAFNEKHAMPTWAASASWALASITTEPIPSEANLAAMRQALAALEALRWGLLLPVKLGQLAEACSRAGNSQEAKGALDRARAVMRDTGQRLAESELHRIEGGLLLVGGSVDQTRAEACYRRAIEVARRQEAMSWELRATTSLARLWRDQGKRQEAHKLLAPVYDWFTEGFDTLDLKEAKAVLDELA